MNELNQLTSDTVKNIEKYERRWHLFKSALYFVIGIAIILVNIYTYNKIIQNNNANRNLLKCAIIAFSPTSQDFNNVTAEVHKCVQNN